MTDAPAPTPSPAPIRVLCVDDNRLMAEAMERRLALEPRVTWTGWVPEGGDAALALSPDVVMLDVDMPGHDSFDLVRRLGDAAPGVRVLMFSGHVRADYIDRAIDAGAWGYVSKNESMDDVLSAILRVVAGEFIATPEVRGEYLRRE